ncbi:MAG: acyl-CoA reductase [Chitinophagaceae bacterium]|nr:acyl-CoA reductase [Chitinophagaceae bacterium]
MILAKRIQVLKELKNWLLSGDDEWKETAEKAYQFNNWFTTEFLEHRVKTICDQYLDEEKLDFWIRHYHLDDNISPKKVGIVMAGNIPMVGFHDFLSSFVTGHKTIIKLSEKDDVLFKKIVEKLISFDEEVGDVIQFADMLKGCDAYIATGSNNTSRYFEYYFGKYPSIIRKNRTSAAVLTGNETKEELESLADDIFLYFGMGCRNITQIFVPMNYDFIPLLEAFKKYEYLKDHARYRNNYDYNLALLIMNNREYMCNENVVMVEEDHLFSPISELYYSYYEDYEKKVGELQQSLDIQCIAGKGNIPFGKTQDAGLFDYADGVDTVQFLLSV